MAPGSFLGLALIVGICVVGVVAQQYWVSEGENPGLWEYVPTAASSESEYGPSVVPSSVEDTDAYVAYGAYEASPYVSQWVERGRDGWGKKKGKKKKKKGKKKKGKKNKAGWGPFSVSTEGVKVGWKGWIPPVKGWGWGWSDGWNGHFSFSDYGDGWGKKQQPHFPDPGPPVIIKHHPVHHKVQHHGWGGWGHQG